MYVYIYIYIYIQRERERHTCIYMYLVEGVAEGLAEVDEGAYPVCRNVVVVCIVKF